MPKRTKAVKTVEDLDTAIKRWTSRLKRAVGKIEQLQRQRKRLLAKPQPAPKPAQEETPKAQAVFPGESVMKIGWVFPEKKDIIERDTRGTDAPQVICVTEDSPLKAPVPPPEAESEYVKADGYDIPTFLRRKPLAPESQAVATQVAEAKKAKAAASAARRKAIKAEVKARDAIPKSKRRWDTNKSQWVSD